MRLHPSHKAAFMAYDQVWRLGMPLLRLHPRMSEGFERRSLSQGAPPPADIWIQAASAGESYLAATLVEHLSPDAGINALITTNTRQGMEILEGSLNGAGQRVQTINTRLDYFPFDHPRIMARAVKAIRPRCMVLLETEIWPGLLAALKSRGNCRILILNGRLTQHSFRRYRLWPSLWRAFRPDRIQAVSGKDASRFAALFGEDRIEVVPNIKFDRLLDSPPQPANPQGEFLLPATPFMVLGSVRAQEEPVVLKMIQTIRARCPDTVIGLFPRHMQRVADWQSALARAGVPWDLRSRWRTPTTPGTVVLWDRFGELHWAYTRARAAFVGGSLAPLGGQNFLEALTAGVIPVIGSSWENFAWIGREIFDLGLARKGDDWQSVAELLIDTLRQPMPHKAVRRQARAYVDKHRGGTRRACRLIAACLEKPGGHPQDSTGKYRP